MFDELKEILQRNESFFTLKAEVLLESSRTSMVEFFLEKVNGRNPLTIFAKNTTAYMLDWVLHTPLKRLKFYFIKSP